MFFFEHVYSSLIHPKWGICNMFNFWQTPLSLQIQGFLENIWNESCQLNTLRSLPISLSYRSRCWRVHSSLGLLLRGWEKYENKLCPVLGKVVVASSQWPSDDLKHSYIYIYICVCGTFRKTKSTEDHISPLIPLNLVHLRGCICLVLKGPMGTVYIYNIYTYTSNKLHR
jgi:hypothetical protein